MESCFSVPNVYYFRHLLRWIVKGTKSSVSPEHISSWSLATLSNLLKIAGFKIHSFSFIDYERFNKASRIANLLPRITKHAILLICHKVNKEHS